MRCAAVQKRIVAWQDAELSPGETVRISEHLQGCIACRSIEQRCAAATPRMELRVPPAIRNRLLTATHTSVLLDLAARRPHRRRVPRLSLRWLHREVEVPRWGILVAAAALVLSVGYALHTARSLDAAHAELAVRATSAPASLHADPRVLPPGHYQPASYQPTEDGGYR